jgi:hypothetical protein
MMAAMIRGIATTGGGDMRHVILAAGVWFNLVSFERRIGTASKGSGVLPTLLVLAFALIGGTAGGDTTSPVLVDTSPQATRRWMTVYTNEVPLVWNWQTGASSAKLSITGLDGGLSTNVSTAASNILWRAFASAVPSGEDVYDLHLTFYTNGTTVVVR